MIVLFKTLQVILALSILIIIHECGHFAFARLFHIRVEKFYLFFDVGGKALCRFKRGDTEFGIGWLPLGGYCKISGMVDESMDLEQLSHEPEPWEFRSHPAWQRLLVMAGGVLFNLIAAILFYIALMGIWGDTYISNKGAKIYVDGLAYSMGFRNGDEILSFDDKVPTDFAMLQADMVRSNANYATVLRGTDTLQLYLDHAMFADVLNTPMMFDLAIPFVVDSVAADGVNAASGLLRGDRITAFDSTRVEFLQDSRDVLASLAGRTVEASVLRDSVHLSLPLQVDSSGRIGIYMRSPEVVHRDYDLLGAVPAGLKMAGSTLGGYIKDLKMVFTPSTGAYKSVGSFIAIGQVFPSSWNWYQFMFILALLSIMLAVMNLLPIPGLDGGHIIFLLYEIFTGRKPSDNFLAVAQIIGLVLLMLMMMLAFGNDIGRLIH